MESAGYGCRGVWCGGHRRYGNRRLWVPGCLVRQAPAVWKPPATGVGALGAAGTGGMEAAGYGARSTKRRCSLANVIGRAGARRSGAEGASTVESRGCRVFPDGGRSPGGKPHGDQHGRRRVRRARPDGDRARHHGSIRRRAETRGGERKAKHPLARLSPLPFTSLPDFGNTPRARWRGRARACARS